ncbi:MAG: phage tail sheath C-terminal domain-containing protein [Bacteroidota bacterium]
MPSTYRTPGAYVEEISIFPSSIAAVETAIPAFIGYTEKAEKNGENLYPKYTGSTLTKPAIPVAISSMLDYVTYFGGAHSPSSIRVDLDANNNITRVSGNPEFYLYESMRMYFVNGGGRCYIISVGSYEDNIAVERFEAGLAALKKEDEPTLIVCPEATLLSTTDLGAIQQAALQQCASLKDRFAVFDVKNGAQFADISDETVEFRNKIGINHLKYGAAYYPFLKCNLPFKFNYPNVDIWKNGVNTNLSVLSNDISIITKLENAINSISTSGNSTPSSIGDLQAAIYGGGSFTYLEWYESHTTAERDQIVHWTTVIKQMAEDMIGLSTLLPSDEVKAILDNQIQVNGDLNDLMQTLLDYDLGYNEAPISGGALGIISTTDFSGTPNYNLSTGTENVAIYGTGTGDDDHANTSAPYFRNIFEKIQGIIADLYNEAENIVSNLERTLRETNPLYAEIVRAIEAEGMILPPSGAMAGIYARIDSTRGVWKAPANVSLNNVIKPLTKIDNEDQDRLNVDPVAGKSINAIRSFVGKGTLVWGSRTLAGNSNEWRYIPVRRFFIMAEESIQKATSQYVFEANDANTWVKLKAMIENFLSLQWRAGALAGATPEQAFFVKVGLGETMTADEIQNGILNIEIGMAVVRPAEFIILKFSHKLQEV